MSAPPQSSSPAIEGFEFQRELARGGMGEVHLARVRRQERLVAVKLLHPQHGGARSEQQRRFEREAELVQSLAHPGLVAVLDHGVLGERFYFVMEYVAGESLRQRLKGGKPLPLVQIRHIVADVVEALSYLEQQGIVHRDLKPENILIAENGQARLTDFGLSSRVTEVGTVTQTEQTLGTYDYMAPEQRSRLPVDTRADQFALAVIVYELLTGRRPLGRFRPPSQGNHRVSQRVDAILFRALQEDPDDRYPSIATFGQDLLQALQPPSRTRVLARIGLLAAGLFPLVASHVSSSVPEGESAGITAPPPNRPVAGLPFHPEPEQPARPKSGTPAGQQQLDVRAEVRRLLVQAEQHEQAHRRRDAIDCYSQALQLAPDDPMLLTRRAHSRLLSNDAAKAREDVEAALRIDPDCAAALVGRGALHIVARDYPQAEVDLSRAIALDPRDAQARVHRGRVHYLRNELAQALVDFNRALELDSRCGMAYFYRSQVRQKLGSHEAALEDLRESARLTPDNPFVHSALAAIHTSSPEARLRDLKKAIEHATLACELSRWSHVGALLQLASARAASGDLAEATRLCDRGLKLRTSESDRRKLEQARKRYQQQLSTVGGSGP